jgi:hypothetical protein
VRWGLYASLIDVNAYHQPGVEAGKKAAGAVLSLQAKLLEGAARAARRLADRRGAGGRDRRRPRDRVEAPRARGGQRRSRRAP